MPSQQPSWKQYLIILVIAVLFTIEPRLAAASGQGSVRPAYDAALEITVKGTVAKIVTGLTPGNLLGTHLLLNTASGQLDVHLGPSVPKDTASLGLAPGETVEIIGAPASSGSGSVLLARVLITSSRVMVLRNEHGIPVPSAGARGGATPQAAKGGRT
jgi:hypothetical protein